MNRIICKGYNTKSIRQSHVPGTICLRLVHEQEILGWRKIMERQKKKVLGNSCFAIQIPQSFMRPFRIYLVNSV